MSTSEGRGGGCTGTVAPTIPTDWPQGKYAAILADPPWNYGNEGPVAYGYASAIYQTMPLEDICALPVCELAAKDACLFLWATMPLLPDALQVVSAWGFTYKTCGFTWVKVYAEQPRRPRIGLGYWTKANAELCLLATRGNPKRIHKDVGQVIAAPIREHSRKPDETHSRIERLVAGPYLELFGRQQRPGWTVWGNEAGKFDELRLFDEERTA